jgi:2-polyprenyl-3-methyl-5-hydroxy-6-metoxy-1,4-benzoquinol methylase
LSREHVGYLERLLDGHRVECLEPIGVRPGQSCVDVGAGGGSITRWLAERAGPTGTVVALDVDTDPCPAIRAHAYRRPGVPTDVSWARLGLMRREGHAAAGRGRRSLALPAWP